MEQIEERKSRPSSVVKNDDPPAKVEEQNTYAADSGGEEDGGQGDIAKNFTQLEIDTFKKMFPSRNTFTFEPGITITSDFDQGNLSKCLNIPVKYENETVYQYEMWLTPDSWPYLPELTAGRAGFFFSMTGIPEAKVKYDKALNCEVSVPRSVKFTFRNMSNQAKLMSYGHSPVYLEVTNSDYQKLVKGKLPFYRQKWKRINYADLIYEKGEDGLEATFSYSLKTSFAKSDHILFAYIYPYTFQDSLLSIQEVEKKC